MRFLRSLIAADELAPHKPLFSPLKQRDVYFEKTFSKRPLKKKFIMSRDSELGWWVACFSRHSILGCILLSMIGFLLYF